MSEDFKGMLALIFGASLLALMFWAQYVDGLDRDNQIQAQRILWGTK